MGVLVRGDPKAPPGEPRFIRFVLRPVGAGERRVTQIWDVTTRRGDALGSVRWYGPWRKYCFFPADGTLYEWQCLRDVATFCEHETTRHKAQRQGAP